MRITPSHTSRPQFPYFYLITEYSASNARPDDFMMSWYIPEDKLWSGLLTDFHFRHDPRSYPRPNQRSVERLRTLFFLSPLLTAFVIWSLFTRQMPNQVANVVDELIASPTVLAAG